MIGFRHVCWRTHGSQCPSMSKFAHGWGCDSIAEEFIPDGGLLWFTWRWMAKLNQGREGGYGAAIVSKDVHLRIWLLTHCLISEEPPFVQRKGLSVSRGLSPKLSTRASHEWWSKGLCFPNKKINSGGAQRAFDRGSRKTNIECIVSLSSSSVPSNWDR